MSKIRVMIVEDSPVVRELLTHIISQDPRLQVSAAVESGEEALAVLDKVSPDVISMDIRLTGMNGFEATRRIMARKPTPIVVVSASVESEELKISMNALRAGALAVLEKPVGLTHAHYEAAARKLCTQLALMSDVKVVRQRTARGPTEPPPKPAGRPAPASPGSFRVMGVAASTGGPNALVEFFQGLGENFPLPVLLVQHITASFLDGFVSWLDGVCPLHVVPSREGDAPRPGCVHVAPADKHLILKGGKLRWDSGPPVSAQRPSGTVLLKSIAAEAGPAGLGVLLTGMGDDGAEGLLAMRNAGGYTLAEDESTAVVYGMPAAAAQIGGVCEQLPLPDIAPRVLDLLAPKGAAS